MHRHDCAIVRYFAALSLAAMIPHAARAQDDPPPAENTDVEITAGVGVMAMPKYPGAEEYRVLPLPAVEISYGQFFLGRDGLGVKLIDDPNGFELGVSGFVEFGRDESDEPVALRGLGDIDAVPQGRIFMSKRFGPVMTRATLKHDFGETDGTVLDIEAGLAMPLGGGGMVFAGPMLSVADENYMNGFFGVSDAQALAGNRSAYDPQWGVYQIGFNLGAQIPLGERLMLGVFGSYRYLVGDAGDSPVISERDQPAGGLFLAYRF